MKIKYGILFLCFLCSNFVWGQEFNMRESISTQQLQTVDPKIFKTLEANIRDLVNNRKWSEDVYELNERITGQIQINVKKEVATNSFEAELIIQAARPIFGSNYETMIFNHIDKNANFLYEENRPINFSNNSYSDNLTSLIGFYMYYILAMDADTFSPLGGDKYYRNAQDVINAIPAAEQSNYVGWKQADSDRNRFWLIENALGPKCLPIRKAMYDYHRIGMDNMYIDPENAKKVLLKSLDDIDKANRTYPNQMLTSVFVYTKGTELVDIFLGGTIQEKERVYQILTRCDPAGINRFAPLRK